jgi:hypothetical protein
MHYISSSPYVFMVYLFNYSTCQFNLHTCTNWDFCLVRWKSSGLNKRLVSLSAYSTLEMKAICSRETSVAFQRTTRRHVPEVCILYNHRCENFKSNACRPVMLSGKVKLSLYRPWRPIGLWEVEAHTFSDIRLIDRSKVVSPTCQPLFTPRKIPGTHFC